MTPLKQRIVTLLIIAGSHGISGDDLFRLVYDGRTRGSSNYTGHGSSLRWGTGGQRGPGEKLPPQREALKAHICQINKQLEHHRIVGSPEPGGWYTLITKSAWSRQSANRRFPCRSVQWRAQPPA